MVYYVKNRVKSETLDKRTKFRTMLIDLLLVKYYTEVVDLKVSERHVNCLVIDLWHTCDIHSMGFLVLLTVEQEHSLMSIGEFHQGFTPLCTCSCLSYLTLNLSLLSWSMRSQHLFWSLKASSIFSCWPLNSSNFSIFHFDHAEK